LSTESGLKTNFGHENHHPLQTNHLEIKPETCI